jgi:FkbM family methyltransferase
VSAESRESRRPSTSRLGEVLDLERPGADTGLDRYGRCLLAYARAAAPLPGRSSAFRKFRRRFQGRRFRVRTEHGFWLEGTLGDSVETQCAVYREFEPGLSRLLGRIAPGVSAFVDLGCNVGYFTCLVGARQPKAKVLAVDANPDVVETCRHNLALNGLHATVLQRAIGEANQESFLHVPRGRATRGTLGADGQWDQPVDTIPVQMTRFADLLDQHRLDPVDLVKIDIEGYESRLFASLDAATALRCELIIFEFAEENLAQCGSSRKDFARVEWLRHFSLFALDSVSGQLRSCPSIASLPEAEVTLALWRNEGSRRLPLEPWLAPA